MAVLPVQKLLPLRSCNAWYCVGATPEANIDNILHNSPNLRDILEYAQEPQTNQTGLQATKPCVDLSRFWRNSLQVLRRTGSPLNRTNLG